MSSESDPLSLPDEHSSSGVCSLNVDMPFRLRLHVGLTRSRSTRRREQAPPPYSKSISEFANEKESEESVVRQGPVRVKDNTRSWFFNINWLVLTDTHLALHPSANKLPRTIVRLSDITKVERTEHESHCLVLETRENGTYLLTFKNDDDIYDWKDAISYRTTGVSEPSSFKHNVHVGWDSVNDNYTGLPSQWAKLLYLQGKSPVDEPMDVGDKSQSHPTLFPQRPFVPLLQTFRTTERILLRINIDTFTDPGHTSLGLSVLADTLMRDVLDHVCRKTNLDTAECSLALTSDSSLTPLNMDDTVANLINLKGSHNLILLTPLDRFSGHDE